MISWILVLSVAIYLVFHLWDRKQIKDEREALIELKTSAIQGQVTVVALIILALVYSFNPDIPAWFCLLAMNIAHLYSEIFGKIYFRAKI